MIWFVADTHYNHRNLVAGESKWSSKDGCRPFSTLREHDDWLVDFINMHVLEDDELFHLGDWSFGGIQRIMEFYDRLTCHNIRMIKGNHDHHLMKYEDKFVSLKHYDEILTDGVSIVLCHYPLESWNNMERGAYHLHGHVHGNSRKIDGRYDVGMEGSIQWDGFSKNAVGLISLDQLRMLPKSSDYRHPGEIHGGNQFGTA